MHPICNGKEAARKLSGGNHSNWFHAYLFSESPNFISGVNNIKLIDGVVIEG